MPITRYSRLATSDLQGIYDNIAKERLRAALRIVASIRKRCLNLAKFPLSAQAHPEYGDNIRYCTFENYVIAYRPTADGIEVARVVHGARDLDSIFKD